MTRRVLIAVTALLGGTLAVGGAVAAPGPVANESLQDVSLQQAAQAGLVTLTSKGGFGGDVVAVDLRGRRIPGVPVRLVTRIEFTGQDGAGKPWTQAKADAIAAAVEGRLVNLRAPDGTPVSIDVQARIGGATATPGWNQIELQDRAPLTDASMSSPEAGDTRFGAPRTGEWGANESPGLYAHEVLHLFGLPDRYNARAPVLEINGRQVPLPRYTGPPGDTAALERWWDSVLAAERAIERREGAKGDIQPGVTDPTDIMAKSSNPAATVKPADLQSLVDRASTHLRTDPGDLLLNKATDQQSLGVGAVTDLTAAPGGTAHKDGVYGYCVELTKHIPARGSGFDVLGPAAAQGNPGLATLQRLLQAVAARQVPDALDGPSGAQDAVWTVTDAADPGSEAAALLASLGLPTAGAAYTATPRFVNPNAAGAGTAAVTTTGVLPALPTAAPPASTAVRLQKASLGGAFMRPSTLRPGRRNRARLVLFVSGGQDLLRIAVQRRSGSRWRAVGRFPDWGVEGSVSDIGLGFPRLRAGSYRLRVTGRAGTRIVRFRVAAAHR